NRGSYIEVRSLIVPGDEAARAAIALEQSATGAVVPGKAEELPPDPAGLAPAGVNVDGPIPLHEHAAAEDGDHEGTGQCKPDEIRMEQVGASIKSGSKAKEAPDATLPAALLDCKSVTEVWNAHLVPGGFAEATEEERAAGLTPLAKVETEVARIREHVAP